MSKGLGAVSNSVSSVTVPHSLHRHCFFSSSAIISLLVLFQPDNRAIKFSCSNFSSNCQITGSWTWSLRPSHDRVKSHVVRRVRNAGSACKPHDLHNLGLPGSCRPTGLLAWCACYQSNLRWYRACVALRRSTGTHKYRRRHRSVRSTWQARPLRQWRTHVQCRTTHGICGTGCFAEVVASSFSGKNRFNRAVEWTSHSPLR